MTVVDLSRSVTRGSPARSDSTLELLDAPRATIGCVQLPTDLTLDEEGPALIARVPGVRLRLQKLELDGDSLDLVTYETGRGRVGRAAATFRPVGSLDALGLACTSLAFTLGRDAVQAELREAQPGAAVTEMATAVLAALEHVGARRVALLTPYLDELHSRNLALLREAGLVVVSQQNLGIATDREISAIGLRSIRDRAIAADADDADALVLGCSAFRACTPGFLDELEERLGKPVISSQQALLWHLLRLAGIEDRVGGYGALLAGRGSRARAGELVELAGASRAGTPEDLYPSRVPEPGVVARVDPVVDPERRFAGPLTDAQLEAIERRGHVTLHQVFAPDEVEALRAATESLRAHYEALSYEELDHRTDMRVITERGGTLAGEAGETPTLKSIWQTHLPPEHAPHMRDAAEISWRAARDARLVGAARQILGDEVYVHQSRVNYQPGWSEGNRGGTGFLWHQDFEQWHSEDGMPRMRAVSMALLLERSIPANGALMVVPGSHLEMLQAFGDRSESDRYAKGALSSGPVIPARFLRAKADLHGILHCRGEPGDVVLFDCNLIHGSHSNISPWGRSMFFTVYNSVSNVPAERPFGVEVARPEHFGSHDPRWAGVPLPALHQSLARPYVEPRP